MMAKTSVLSARADQDATQRLEAIRVRSEMTGKWPIPFTSFSFLLQTRAEQLRDKKIAESALRKSWQDRKLAVSKDLEAQRLVLVKRNSPRFFFSLFFLF